MITISIPDNNTMERKYIIDIIFGEFLGLKYQLERGGENNYHIDLNNGNTLIIEDNFFNKFPVDLEYLQEKNIPDKIEFIDNEFLPEKNLPLIYGSEKLIKKSKSIICGIDIFASSFFMLTRWEEYINKTRDNHNRFPAYESAAGKFDFLNRPVVNEYTEFLYTMLKHLGLAEKRMNRKFSVKLTHDVDVLRRYKSTLSVFRETAGDILKRKVPVTGLNKLIEFAKIKTGISKDPFDTFDYLMTLSEKYNQKSYFFFMAGGETKHDNNYKIDDLLTKKIIKNIKERGHQIGFHPSYNTYNDAKQFKRELEALKQTTNQDIKFGRQHFLRFEVPTTWQQWEDCGLEWDSTLSYADKEGFRCGTCYTFSVFNILTRKKLKLKEKPLIVMEGSFITYQPNINSEKMLNNINELISKTKKYKGEFVFLWHNSSFNTPQWIKFQKNYAESVSTIERSIQKKEFVFDNN